MPLGRSTATPDTGKSDNACAGCCQGKPGFSNSCNKNQEPLTKNGLFATGIAPWTTKATYLGRLCMRVGLKR